MNARRYTEAVSQYTTALSLGPASPHGLLIKRSNAWASKGARKDSLSDAKEWARLMLMSGSWQDALTARVSDYSLTLASVVCLTCLACSLHSKNSQPTGLYVSISKRPVMLQTQLRVSTKFRVNWHRMGSKQIGLVVSVHVRRQGIIPINDHQTLNLDAMAN